MGDCLSSESQQNSPYSRLREGHQYNTLNDRDSRHLLSSSLTPSSSASSSADEQHPPPSSSRDEQTSNKERELQKQLDAARRELEEERAKLWSCEAQMELTLTDIEQEVCRYKNQLSLVVSSLEREYRDWETVRGRLETQVERERLKVRARDVQIHELKLSKEQEMSALSSQLMALRHQLESDNRELKEHMLDSSVCTKQPVHS